MILNHSNLILIPITIQLINNFTCFINFSLLKFIPFIFLIKNSRKKIISSYFQFITIHLKLKYVFF